MTTHRTPPWEKKSAKPAPGADARVKLTAANIAWAKSRAKKAGRRYPNLVDNMAATRRQQGEQHRAHPLRGLRGDGN